MPAYSSNVQPPTASQAPAGYSIQVLDRVFRILEMLADRPARVAEISAGLELHRATVFRLLANLEQRGYVRKDETAGTYSLGMTLFQLGTKALEEQFPIHRLRPMLDDLATATGHTAQLWIRSGNEALCVDQVESPRDLRVVGRVGRRLPLDRAAVGKVLLAFAPARLLEEVIARPLPRIGPRLGATASDPGAELALVRAQGWSLSAGALRINSLALAAPVYNALGVVEMAVCVLAVEDGLAEAGMDQVRAAVLDTAARMSRTLGFLPEPLSRQPLPLPGAAEEREANGLGAQRGSDSR